MDKYMVGYQPEKDWHAVRYLAAKGKTSEIAKKAIQFEEAAAESVVMALNKAGGYVVWDVFPYKELPAGWQNKHDDLMDTVSMYFRGIREGEITGQQQKEVSTSVPEGLGFGDYSIEQMDAVIGAIQAVLKRN